MEIYEEVLPSNRSANSSELTWMAIFLEELNGPNVGIYSACQLVCSFFVIVGSVSFSRRLKSRRWILIWLFFGAISTAINESGTPRLSGEISSNPVTSEIIKNVMSLIFQIAIPGLVAALLEKKADTNEANALPLMTANPANLRALGFISNCRCNALKTKWNRDVLVASLRHFGSGLVETTNETLATLFHRFPFFPFAPRPSQSSELVEVVSPGDPKTNENETSSAHVTIHTDQIENDSIPPIERNGIDAIQPCSCSQCAIGHKKNKKPTLESVNECDHNNTSTALKESETAQSSMEDSKVVSEVEVSLAATQDRRVDYDQAASIENIDVKESADPEMEHNVKNQTAKVKGEMVMRFEGEPLLPKVENRSDVEGSAHQSEPTNGIATKIAALVAAAGFGAMGGAAKLGVTKTAITIAGLTESGITGAGVAKMLAAAISGTTGLAIVAGSVGVLWLASLIERKLNAAAAIDQTEIDSNSTGTISSNSNTDTVGDAVGNDENEPQSSQLRYRGAKQSQVTQ